MASKEQILGILAGASAAMSRKEMEEKIGESYRGFQTQLDRLVKQELIEDTGDHKYVLTDKGREEALHGEFDEIPDDEPPSGEKKEETQATAQTTEYQQFLRLGKQVGVVPLSLIKVTTDHIWNGDYQDLKWVASGLQQMGIQRDLANRWFNAWASHMKKPLPTDLPSDFQSPEVRKVQEKEEAEKKQGAGKRDYVLNADDVPEFVGEGNGSLDYKDAVDLSKIRAARRKDGTSSSPGSMADEVTKIFKAFKELAPEKVAGKTFLFKPGSDGSYQMEEVDPSKPIVLPAQAGIKPADSYLVSEDGQVQKLEAGKPVVIIKQAPSSQGNVVSQKTVLVDKRTGETTEVAPGAPVIIIRESAAQSQMTPITIKDKDGNPMVLDLSTWFRLEEHKDKQRRDEESHQVKMDIAKTFKDALNKAGKALANMGEKEE